jgi:hypothetical protein
MPAQAQNAPSNFSLGVTAGSLGIGPEAGARINSTIGVRANASFLDFDHDFDVNDIDYTGKVKLESYGANIDLYPFDGGFRLSAGFRINRNQANAVATPSSSVTVGDATFTPVQIGTLTGNARTNDVAPTLTVGYAGGLTKGIKFGIDAGAMFQGSPTVGELQSTGRFANDPTFKAQLEKERQDLNNKVDDYKVYPILQLSLFYAF